ncbi:MAG: YncE family protein [Bacteroidetes bacterium]|nr:YncE family protein [Bacteroidota bacterium]
MKKLTPFFVALFLLAMQNSFAQSASVKYKVIKTIPVEGNGGWDYLTVDKPTQRLFISHGTCVEVLDLKTEKLIGQIPNTPGVHGIAIVNALNKGFITAGRIDSVIVFDLVTLQVIDKVSAGKNPDAILYDAFSNRIFTFNGKGNSVTAIDAKSNRVVGTLPVSGKPEAAVSDGKGKIFCNIEDKSTVVKFDALSLKIDAEWPLEPGKEPTGLDIDVKNNRLFAACSGSQQIIVMDVSNGKPVAALHIGEGCDGIIFIPGDHNAISSNGEGTLTVVHQNSADDYNVVQTLPTRKNARTITYDETTKRIYLPTAEVTTQNGKRIIIPGSFKILVVSK